MPLGHFSLAKHWPFRIELLIVFISCHELKKILVVSWQWRVLTNHFEDPPLTLVGQPEGKNVNAYAARDCKPLRSEQLMHLLPMLCSPHAHTLQTQCCHISLAVRSHVPEPGCANTTR